MSSVIIAGNTSGTITLDAPAVAGTTTLTLPTTSGTVLTTASTFAGTGPAFSAYATASNSLTNNTFIKISLNAEEFDTAGYFDSTTNYRFTPLIAGYYQFSCAVNVNSAAAGVVITSFFKNGSEFKRCNQMNLNVSSTNSPGGSALIYMNGSTDYIELYCLQNSGGTILTSSSGAPYVYMNGFLARSA
jgi:hypothetical protein